MTHLDDEDYRERLQNRLEELKGLEESGDEAAGTVELDQSRMGRLSRMDAIQQQAMAREARERRVNEIRRIGAALDRLETGDYGLCEECGEQIARQRLDHDPAVALCIECAEQRE